LKGRMPKFVWASELGKADFCLVYGRYEPGIDIRLVCFQSYQTSMDFNMSTHTNIIYLGYTLYISTTLVCTCLHLGS
jgi:hypothetical protein